MSLEGRRHSLRTLPHPNALPGQPWALRTTKQVAAMLDVDAASFTVWRYRGLAPQPEPPFFKGSALTYRLDRVQSWLARRLGLPYGQQQAWAEGLKQINFEPEPDVCDQVRRLVELLGPEWAQPPGCRWSVGGFGAYLDSLVCG